MLLLSLVSVGTGESAGSEATAEWAQRLVRWARGRIAEGSVNAILPQPFPLEAVHPGTKLSFEITDCPTDFLVKGTLEGLAL